MARSSRGDVAGRLILAGASVPGRSISDLDETFIAMNGDILTSLDFRELVEYHHQQQATLTLATRADGPGGSVSDRDNGRVVGYREKPTLSYSISTGIYVYEPRALSYLPETEADQHNRSRAPHAPRGRR